MTVTYAFIGVMLGFCAEFWVAWGNIQVKYSHKLDAMSDKPRPVYKRSRWWFGFLLYILNAAFNIVSYMFASLNILAPTSALTIVINGVLARIYFGEKLTRKGIFGSILIMIGCLFAIWFGSHAEGTIVLGDLLHMADNIGFLSYGSFNIALIIICVVLGTRMHQHVITPKQKLSTPQTTTSLTSMTEIDTEDDPFPDSKISSPFTDNDNDNDNDNLNMHINFGDPIKADDIDDDDDSDDNSDIELHIIDNIDEDSIQKIHNNIEKKKKEEISINNNNNIFSPVYSKETFQSVNSKYQINGFFATERKFYEGEKFRHGLRAVMLAFAASGVVSWVQILVKIQSELLFSTISGNNQFNKPGTYVILIMLLCLVSFQLHLISENMRIFDAVLIVPLYNSFLIGLSVTLSGIYFKDFQNFSWYQCILFGFGLFCIGVGIIFVAIGQNEESMNHHEIDQINYLEGKKKVEITSLKHISIDNSDSKGNFNNILLPTISETKNDEINDDYNNDNNIVDNQNNNVIIIDEKQKEEEEDAISLLHSHPRASNNH